MENIILTLEEFTLREEKKLNESAKSDTERALKHYNIPEEDWNKLSKEDKEKKINNLPEPKGKNKKTNEGKISAALLQAVEDYYDNKNQKESVDTLVNLLGLKKKSVETVLKNEDDVIQAMSKLMEL